MTHTSRGRAGVLRPVLATGLLTACLALTGCEDSAGAPAASPSSAPATEGTSGSPDPTTAPADGKQVDTSLFTARVPAGWRVQVVAPDFTIVASGPELEHITFLLTPMFGDDLSLAQLARASLRTQPWSPKPHPADESSLDGEPAYHLAGPVGHGYRTDAFGLQRQDTHVSVDIETRGSVAEQQQVVDAVLATWQWK